MTRRDKCRQCDTEMHPETIDTVKGQHGMLQVTMSGFPVMVCERGHRHFMIPDFPMKLMQRVANERHITLPAGNKKGLIFKKYLCGRCGEKLGTDARAVPFGLEVGLEDFPIFRVEISVPVYTCSACGQEQLRDGNMVRELTAAAMAQGFQAAGLRPEA